MFAFSSTFYSALLKVWLTVTRIRVYNNLLNRPQLSGLLTVFRLAISIIFAIDVHWRFILPERFW